MGSAFAPVNPAIKSLSSLNAFEGELGDQAPLNYWDPLGLSADGDQEKFDRYRYVELKHGRICMLAFLGEVTTRAGIHLPGSVNLAGDKFDAVTNGWKAIGALPKEGVLQLLAFVGFLELFVMKDITGEGEFPGDFRNGFIDYGWDTFDFEEQESKRRIELSNGRAAMIGVLIILVADQVGYNLPILSGI